MSNDHLAVVCSLNKTDKVTQKLVREVFINSLFFCIRNDCFRTMT